jgi:hypothetical protein
MGKGRKRERLHLSDTIVPTQQKVEEHWENSVG